MGEERKGESGETGDSNQIVDLVARVSKIAIQKLCESGIRPEELIFIPEDGKEPVLNPILAALSLEFLQFEEFRIPDDNKLYVSPDRENLPARMSEFDSKCELAVSKVLASPWASVSTIRGREISSVLMVESIAEKSGIEFEKNIQNPDVTHSWIHSIGGGYSSSQELFEPVANATASFIRKIESVGNVESFSVVPINNIPDREVGWKLLLKLKG